MLRRISLALGKVTKSFTENRDGSVVLNFAIALIPIMVGIGAAVDFSRANNYKAALQAALDAAVLAGIKDGSPNWSQVASNVFKGNLPPKFGTPPTPSFATDNVTATYTGTVTGSQPTSVMGLVAINSISVTVRSAAVAGTAPDNSCILTLDQGQPKSDVSLTLNGAPNINLSGCNIRSNTSMTCNGHDGNATTSIASGSASGCAHPQSNAPTVPDIYAALASNITKQCGASLPGVTWNVGTVPTGSAIVKIIKGSYTEYHICGDLTLSGSGYLTGSAPTGDTVIIVENGNLNMANNAAVDTSRVSFVLSGNNNHSSQIIFPNGNGHAASLTLSPSLDTGNPWRGVALYQDPSLTNNIDDNWGPGATFNADGLVYLPHANVTTRGNSASGNANCSKYVMNTFTTNGSINLNFSQSSTACTAIGLVQATGIPTHLVQ